MKQQGNKSSTKKQVEKARTKESCGFQHIAEKSTPYGTAGKSLHGNSVPSKNIATKEENNNYFLALEFAITIVSR